MFSFNSGYELPRLQQAEHFWKYTSKGQLIIEFFSSLGETAPSEVTEGGLKTRSDISSDHDYRDRFMDMGNHHLLDFVLDSETTVHDDPDNPQNEVHQQPLIQSMGFIRSFCLEKVFSPKPECVNFDLALAALDHLQGLEWTRQDAIQGAINKLGIAEHNWQEVLSNSPMALEWVKDNQYWNAGLEICFAELYVGLRIWIMVYELTAKTIVKRNALAMLNTLFPPCVKRLPRQIPSKVIHLLRATFYQYMILVEASGASALDGYIRNLDAPCNKYAWKNVRECITDYIHYVDDMMQKAREVQSVEYFRNEHAGAIPHSPFRFDCSEVNSISLSQWSESPTVSNLSRTSSTKSDTPQMGHESHTDGPPSPKVSTSLKHTPQHFGIMTTGRCIFQESEVEYRENSSSEVRRRVLQEQRVTSLSGRPITSDDVILPGTPLLPDGPDAIGDSNLNVPIRSSILLPSTGGDLPHSGAFELSSSGYCRPELKSKTSLPELIRKRLSFGSSSTSRTLRESFKNQNGLCISLGLSESAENFTGNDPNVKLPVRTVERRLSPGKAIEDSISIHSLFRSRSSTFRGFRAIVLRAGSRQSEAIEVPVSANNHTAHQIKKKRSLPGLSFRSKSHPSRRDSEPLFLKVDDEYERYALLSELQPVTSLPIMRRQKLRKATSCVTLKSVAHFQAAINLTTPSYGSTKGKKLTKIKSMTTFNTGPESAVYPSPIMHIERFQKPPKSEPYFFRCSSPQSPAPKPWSVRASEPINFNWDTNSDDWRSRENIRDYYLEVHRAKRFNLNHPEGGPYRSTAKASDGIERQDRPRARLRANSQRPDSIFPNRDSSKTPTVRNYTMIDIKKYAK